MNSKRGTVYKGGNPLFQRLPLDDEEKAIRDRLRASGRASAEMKSEERKARILAGPYLITQARIDERVSRLIEVEGVEIESECVGNGFNHCFCPACNSHWSDDPLFWATSERAK